MEKRSKGTLKRTLALVLTCVMVLSLLPGTAFAARSDTRDMPVAETPAENAAAAETAELPTKPFEAVADLATGERTYYVSLSGRGGNSGLSEDAPLPGLDAVPWADLQAGDSVLLKKGDKFPGSIRLVDVHGTADAPITIGAYGDGAAAPVIEARGQGIWLQETGSTATLGKYASSGVLLYGCSYVTVEGLDIVNIPDPMKATLETTISGKSNTPDMTYSGVAVAADGSAAAEGIVLRNITVHGNSDVSAVITETSSTVTQDSVTVGTAASVRTYTPANGTYYVSSLNGSDSNDGTSQTTAFYSLHKINELDLQPGAKVYLERGSVFENQYLHIEGGGAENTPVIIDAYGDNSAAKPLINTNGNGVWYQNMGKNLDNGNHVRYGYVSSCINLYDVPYIEIKNLAMTNGGEYGKTVTNFDSTQITMPEGQEDGGTVPGETGYNSTNGNTIGCYQWGGKMSRTGVSGVAQNAGTVHHVYLQNLDIEEIYGNVYIKHMNNGGIYFTVSLPANESSTGISRFDDLRIEGCYLRRVSRWGIAAAYTAYWNQMNAMAISDQACQTYGSTKVYIGHNYLEEVGGDPITTMYDYEPLIEYNVALRGAREIQASFYMNGTAPNNNKGNVAAGIWPWKCKTALFEHNECYDMMHGGNGNNDAQAWDADYGDSTIYQYNYSSGNTGGCVMYCNWNAYNTVFRYNISYKDGKVGGPGNNIGPLDFATAINGQMYNNTFLFIQDSPAYHRNNGGNGAYIENNIFYNTGDTAYEPNWTASSNLYYKNNIYSGFSSTGNDSYPIELTAEERASFFAKDIGTAPIAPKSTDKTGTGDVDGIRNWTYDWDSDYDMFKLGTGATKAKNASVPIGNKGLIEDASFGVPRVPNNKDFYGNALDAFHDIGAHDTRTADPEGVTVSAVDHESATVQWSAVAGAVSYKVALDGGEPVDAETLSSHIFLDLFPMAEYTVSVTAYDESGNAVGAARTAEFTTTRPAAPENPDAIQPVAVKAGSEQSSEEKGNAIDGNPNTIWHTAWNGSQAEDRWIAVDLGRVQSIQNFQYLPRPAVGTGGTNGLITQYEIYLSSSDSDWTNPGAAGSWTKAKEGAWSWDAGRDWVTVAFDANTTARYVKLKCVTGVGNHASAAEIAVNGVPCESIALANASVALNKTLTLPVTTTPTGAAVTGIVWTSSDRKVATVDTNGVVTGLSVGETTITAHLGDKTAACTVTVTPRELSDAHELVSSLFEIRDTDKLQVPYTANDPTTVAELKAGLTVSEAATVKVLDNSGTEQTDAVSVAAGMTVSIVAENGTSHTDYTVVQKNVYNSYEDWQGGVQGNVWFSQYEGAEAGTFLNHTAWNNGGWWDGAAPNYMSVERNQACGSITGEKGSGFTFRAPVEGIVTLQLNYYDGTSLSAPTGENQVRKRQASSNGLTHHIRIYLNGVELEDQVINVPQTVTPVDVTPMQISLKQGDLLNVVAKNGGNFASNSGNNSIFFNPKITYENTAYVPAPEEITLDESVVTLYTNEGLTNTAQLAATVLPAEAAQAVTWTTGDEAVATVDSNGLVTAVGNGDTFIRATSNSGLDNPSVNVTCQIHVLTKIEGITIKEGNTTIGAAPIKLYTNEGDDTLPHTVTLTAETTPANVSHPNLNWTRPEGPQAKIEVVREGNGASAVLTATTNEQNVGAVTVEVASVEHPDVKTTFTVHVVRKLQNPVTITGNAKVGETLTANLNQLSMTDAGKNALTIQWKRDGVDIPDATGKSYALTEADYNTTISVDVTADPNTFYEGTQSASITGKVAMQDGPAAPEGLNAVQCVNGDDGKITGLDSTKAYEYSADGTAWTSVAAGATEITGLAAGTYQVRFAATDTQAAGAAVTKTILAASAAGYDITFDVTEGGALDVSKNPAEENDQITITVTPEAGYQLVADSLTVTHTGDAAQTVTVTDNTFTMPAANVTIHAEFEKQKFQITHELENIDCEVTGEHTHEVAYGDKPVIHLTAKEGYTMPSSVAVIKTGSQPEEAFAAYTYSHTVAAPEEATITFDQGVTGNLTIKGAGVIKTFAVNYSLKNNLSTTSSRSANYKAEYTGTLVAADGYALPESIVVTMNGTLIGEANYTYDRQTGTITIPEGKITGNIVITAVGVDVRVEVVSVTGVKMDRTSASVAQNGTLKLTCTITPADATNKEVVWSTGDPSIVTVDEDGTVHGVSEGSTTITVMTLDGRLTDSCVVTVTKRSGGASTGSGSGGVTTKTETREDGSKVTTVTKPDGSKTVTVEQPDGTKSETVTTKDGDVTITVTDENGEELVKAEIPATIVVPETRFEDVSETHWANEAIHNIAALKLVNGTGENKYSPVAPMTRGSLATVLHRLSQGKTDYEVTFQDVAQGKYYTEGVAWAAKVKVVTGYTEEIFAPDDIITREQLAVMMARYAKLVGLDTKADAKALDQFVDGDTTGTWAVDGVAWCVQNGILKGKGNDTLDPTAEVTRAEVAVMLDRFIALLK